MHGNIAALYEDGYVRANSDYFGENEPIELNDIIKVSPHFDVGFVALKNDGKMFVQSEEGVVDNWLEQVGTWDDITSIDFHRSSGAASGIVHEGAVIGITKNNELKIAMYDFMNFGNESYYDREILNRFKNIVCVDANINDNFLNLAALDNNGHLLTEIDGVFNSYDVEDAIDVELFECYDNNTSRTYYEIYLLHSNGNVYKYGSNNYIITDVIYMDNGVIVTRSGRIYRFTDEGIVQTEGKTRIVDEWLERVE